MKKKGAGPLKTAGEPNDKIQYTDLHCHILPGLDDGAGDWDEALAMAKNAVKSGAVKLVATPHVMRGVYYSSPDDIKAKTAELNVRLENSGVPLDVIPGSEIYLSAGTAVEYRGGKLQTIGESGYLLVELPALYLPEYAHRELFDLRVAGAGVILAHPERNRELSRRRDALLELYDSDVLFQVNAGSFLGVYGRQARACAEFLLKEGLAHFIGSDAHSGQSAALSDVGADITGSLRRIAKFGRSGETFLAAAEARSQRLLSGKF